MELSDRWIWPLRLRQRYAAEAERPSAGSQFGPEWHPFSWHPEASELAFDQEGGTYKPYSPRKLRVFV